jgi:hypothetical protein
MGELVQISSPPFFSSEIVSGLKEWVCSLYERGHSNARNQSMVSAEGW